MPNPTLASSSPAARPAWMASRMHARPLAVICADARRAGCDQCRAPAGIPCVLGSLGTTGYHVARFAAAYKAGLISGTDFTAVTDAATVFTGSTIVFGGAR